MGADLKLASQASQGCWAARRVAGRARGTGLGAVGVSHCGRSFRVFTPGGIPDINLEDSTLVEPTVLAQWATDVPHKCEKALFGCV